ncbi:MAG: DoxX family protein [Proteobacteria bacterium]|nr:DoxX family protein [Pseudomonadota bacterium]
MNTDDFGKLVLRLMLGGLLLFHGVNKILTGIDPIREMIGAHHLPEFLAYGVYAGEVVAPVLLILGLFARIGGALVVVNMIVAILLVHTGMLFGLDGMGGYALELQAFYLFSGLAVALLGAGRYAIGGQGLLN